MRCARRTGKRRVPVLCKPTRRCGDRAGGSFLLGKQRIEPGARDIRVRIGCGAFTAAEAEILAESPGLLLDLPLRLRLATLIVRGRLVKRAVQAALEIGAAVDAGITSPDAFDGADAAPTVMTHAFH